MKVYYQNQYIITLAFFSSCFFLKKPKTAKQILLTILKDRHFGLCWKMICLLIFHRDKRDRLVPKGFTTVILPI